MDPPIRLGAPLAGEGAETEFARMGGGTPPGRGGIPRGGMLPRELPGFRNPGIAGIFGVFAIRLSYHTVYSEKRQVKEFNTPKVSRFDPVSYREAEIHGQK